MSHIDSFKHELVGFLGSVPVYHPLEDIKGDFICTPNQLLIGGGSGEHPAVVVENLTEVLALFLDKTISENKAIKSWKSIIEPYLNESNLLTFYEWDLETRQNFIDMCSSDVLPNPYEAEINGDFNTWFILGIGEFIFFSLPHLSTAIMTKLKHPYKNFHHSYYNNIMLVPPNFPVYPNGGNLFFKN